MSLKSSPLHMLCAALLGAGCGNAASEEPTGEEATSTSQSGSGAKVGNDAGAESSAAPLPQVDCAAEKRADAFSTGMNKSTEEGTVVSLAEAVPAPPARHDNDWVLELTNRDGEPVVDAQLSLSPFMPDHGHGSPREAVVEGLGGGRYSAGPVSFFMPGFWSVEVEIRQTNGDTERTSFGFCIP